MRMKEREPERVVEFESLRLLLAGGLTLLLISWPLLGWFFRFGNRVIFVLGAAAISLTIVVVSLPVALKGSGGSRLAALLIMAMPLVVFAAVAWWVIARAFGR